MTDPVIMELVDPLRHSLEEAARMAKMLLHADPMLDVRLAHALPRTDGQPSALSPKQCARLLHVLDGASAGSRLVPVVLHLARHPDPRLRSKAALFVSRRIGKTEWVNRFLGEEDVRVRANAIEGLWGLDLPAARHLLREAVEDKAARVAGNALYGLFLLKDRVAPQALREMAAAPDPARVAVAAWVMGQTGDASWIPLLQRLAKEPAGNIKRAALRSLVRLRRAGPLSHKDAKRDSEAPISNA